MPAVLCFSAHGCLKPSLTLNPLAFISLHHNLSVIQVYVFSVYMHPLIHIHTQRQRKKRKFLSL